MYTEILCAVISGAVTLVGVLIANNKSQAVTETRLDELTWKSVNIIILPSASPCWKKN